MSNRARLLLLSGIGGAGTTSACAATFEALADEGVRARRVADPGPGRAMSHDLVSGSIGRVLGDLGADPVQPAAWDALPGVTHLSVLLEVLELLATPGVEAIVVDCGDLRRARELVELPSVLLRLLDAALTPRLAMWRSTTPTGGTDDVDTAFESLARARERVRDLQAALAHPATTMRLVTTAQEWAIDRTLVAAAEFPLLGVGVDGIIVNRYPRKSGEWPRSVLEEHAAGLGRLREGSAGVEVWKCTDSVRGAPKGRSAMGPLGRVHVLDADQITVHAADEEYFLDVPLVGAAITGSEVGRLGNDLVVQFGDVRRWLPLPALLRRCRATHAQRTAGGLRISFVPDASVWRSPDRAAS